MMRSASPITAASQKWQPSRRQAMVAAPLLTAGFSSFRPQMALAATPAVPTVNLTPDLEISRVIKGCWQLSGGHSGDRGTDRTSGGNAVADFQPFIDAGIFTLDTADIYGPSETLIGEFLKKTTPESREKCRVLTKFCCFGQAMNQARKMQFVEESIDRSRSHLGVKSLDLIQFYWHDLNNHGYVDAALHLTELQAKGKVRAVGVTNFDTKTLAEMVDAGAPIVSNQVQYSLLDPRPENGMVRYCLDHGIQLLPYGTVCGGFLSEKFLGKRPQDVTVNTYSLSKYSSVISQRGGWEWLQSLLRTLQAVGNQYNVSIADVASKWVLQRPAVAGIIVGARNARHVGDHVALFGFDLSEEDLSLIQGVLDEGRVPQSDCYTWERGGEWV